MPIHTERKSAGLTDMIYRAINLWLDTRDRVPGRPVGVVLHTSCVNYSEEALRSMGSLAVRWILPDNVRWELRLLLRSRIFGRRAEMVLNCVDGQRDMDGLPKWDLEQLYEGCTEPVTPEEIFPGTLVFAFGDLNKQDEFTNRVRPLPGHFVLVCTEWNCRESLGAVMPLESVRGCGTRRVRALEYGGEIPRLSRISGIECQIFRGDSIVVTGRDLTATEKGGNYGIIHECGRIPGRYVKLYRSKTARGNYTRKLRKLAMMKHWLGPCTVALPERLLVLRNDEVIGFSMVRCRGSSLNKIPPAYWKRHDSQQVLRRLTLMLLELHCLHILVGDLSSDNILVDENDRVYLVDCDSFQVEEYPGGGIKEAYQHPQIKTEECARVLRDPRHEYFAFAVLLFQFLHFCDPLLQKLEKEDHRELKWDEVEFQLEAEQTENPNVHEAMLRLWNKQDPTVRKLFADEFHFRAEHSFGAWIRALELID